VVPRQGDLEDALGKRPQLGLSIEAEEAGPKVEDAVAVGGEAGQQLLGPLESETPIDDRKAENVEPLGGRKRRDALGDGSAQGPYLATDRAR
jgi:hypothetical protein